MKYFNKEQKLIRKEVGKYTFNENNSRIVRIVNNEKNVGKLKKILECCAFGKNVSFFATYSSEELLSKYVGYIFVFQKNVYGSYKLLNIVDGRGAKSYEKTYNISRGYKNRNNEPSFVVKGFVFVNER